MDNPQNDTNDQERDLESGSAATADELQRRQRGSLPSFLFITFLFFMLTNRTGEDAVMRSRYEDTIRALGYQLSNYSAWLNGTATNFTLPERDVHVERLTSEMLPPPYQLEPSSRSYYSNTTGLFRGNVRYYNLSSIPYDTDVTWKSIADRVMENANLSATPERLGTWNWSAADRIRIRVYDRIVTVANASENVAIFQGKLELTDPGVRETMLLEFDGVHFTKNGSFYAFAQEEGSSSIDIRYIPSIVPISVQNATAVVLQDEMNRRLSKLRTMADLGAMVEQVVASEESQAHRCPFTFYGQLTPTYVPEKLMLDLEQEIFEPSGISTVDPPRMILKGVLISKLCGILYHIDESAGMNTWNYSRNAITYAGWSSVIYLVMLFLLSRQIAASRTPAGISRLSRWTFFTQTLIDIITFAILISLAVAVNARACIPLIAPAALAVVLLVHEMQFTVLIYRVQLLEDNALSQTTTQTTQAQNPPTAIASPGTATTNDGTVSQTTVPETQLPTVGGTTGAPSSVRSAFLWFSNGQMWNDPHMRIWFTLSFFLSAVQLVMWFSLPFTAAAVAYSMLWLPQIVRSAMRGRTAALTTEYIVGTTICRLLFAFYYLGYSKNILEITPRPWIWTFAGWMTFQVFAILLQNFYGPAFFLPARFVTVKTYDYHPPMRLPDPESPDRSLGDCAICMDAIIIDPPAGEKETSTSKDAAWTGAVEGHSGGIFGAVHRNVVGTANMRKNYSLAPCHHLFHTSCLKTWLAIKNICPQCRRPLPPL